MKIIQFSGGKDSVVCLHMYRNDPDVVALYIDTGNAFEHVRKYVQETCEKYKVKLHVRGPDRPVDLWQDEYGLPSDVVPWDSTPMMRDMVKKNFTNKIIPYSTCCTVNIWLPLMNGVLELGAKTVIRGSKACDEKVGVKDGYVDENGISFMSPLWDWTDEDVFSYIEKHNIVLPKHYTKDNDSLDCWSCTAYMGPHGKERLAYLKKEYPDIYPKAIERFNRVKSTVKNAVEYFYS